jgi:hypothetical protein
MQRSSGPRKIAALPDSIHHQLSMYALAASAAGVGMLALAPPAAAKIVYTPAHVIVPSHSRYGIDLDHDGTADISLGRGAASGATYVWASGRNGVAAEQDNTRWALAILRGGEIASSKNFVSSSSFLPALAVGSSSGAGHAVWRGQWANRGNGVKNRYLGIKFRSGGQLHYGWARITITIDNRKKAVISKVLLSGYAYETIPNKPIIAGSTNGPDNTSVEDSTAIPERPTLGALAMGAPGLSIWRREETPESIRQ